MDDHIAFLNEEHGKLLEAKRAADKAWLEKVNEYQRFKLENESYYRLTSAKRKIRLEYETEIAILRGKCEHLDHLAYAFHLVITHLQEDSQ